MWWILLLLVFFSLWHYFTKRKKLSHIPGPPGLPIIGNAAAIEPTKMHLILTDWAQQYGPVYRVRLPGSDLVVVSEIKAALEALVTRQNDFSGRTPSYRFDLLTFNGSMGGVDWNNHAKLMRKTALRALHAHNIGMKHMQGIIQGELEELVDYIETNPEGDMNMKTCLSGAVVNTITTLLFGERLGYGSLESCLLKQIFEEGTAALDPSGGLVIDDFPLLRFLPLPSIQKVMKKVHETARLRDILFDETIHEHVKHLDETHPRGVIDELYLEQKLLGNEHLSENDIKGLLVDFTFAGTMSSTSALISLVLLLVHHPDVQRRMQEEIDDVVGTGRLPNIADREKMPYCQAAIRENFRYTSTAPTTIPHKALVDSSIAGFQIPKGTRVLFNLFAIHHDEAYWKDPYTYNPENFLNQDGSLRKRDITNTLSYLPFGAGSRNCPGESLAKSRIFLFATTLLQRYTILPPDDAARLPSCSMENFKGGNFMLPPDYRAKMVSRQA